MKTRITILLGVVVIFMAYAISFGWILKDEFTTARSAGAVNSTSAEPIGGTRTVVDTGDNLSIVDGNLKISSTEDGLDPSIRWASVSRSVGKLLFTKLGSETENPNFTGVGFSSADTPLSPIHFIDVVRSSQIAFLIGATVSNYGYENNSTLADTTLAISLRNTGAYYFYKFPPAASDDYWQLFAVTTSGDATTLYPFIAVDVHDDSPYADQIFAFIRIPNGTYVPTPICYTTFGSSFTCDSTGPEGQTSPQPAWDTGETWSVASGEAKNTPVYGAELSSGKTVLGTWYKITASEAMHFGDTLTVGSTYFDNNGEIILDASNKVKEMTFDPYALIPITSQHNYVSATISALETQTIAGCTFLAGDGEMEICDGEYCDPYCESSCEEDPDPESCAAACEELCCEENMIELEYHIKYSAVLTHDASAQPECCTLQDVTVLGSTASNLSGCITCSYTPGGRMETYIFTGEDYSFYTIIYDGGNIASDVSIELLPITNLQVGLVSTSETNRLDNFLVISRGENGEHAGLDARLEETSGGGSWGFGRGWLF